MGNRHYDLLIEDDISQMAPPKWKQTLDKIPSLEGQLIGGDLIIFGHNISLEKFTYTKRYKVEPEREFHGMKLVCSCGYIIDDVIPLVTYVAVDMTGAPIVNRMRDQSISFDKLEDIILNHLPKPVTKTEVEYITFTMEWLEDCHAKFAEEFLDIVHESGGILQKDFDRLEFILVDDKMSDVGVAKLREMLEGHPIGVRKMKVIK